MLELGTFTGHTLPIWANWSQFLGAITLPVGLIGFYLQRQCHVARCMRLSWHVGPDGHPRCRKHHPESVPRA